MNDCSEETYVYSSLKVVVVRKFKLLHRQRNLMLLLLLLGGDVETCPGPGQRSLTREEFKQSLKHRGINMVHQNIRGLQNNFDILQEFVMSHNEIDIFSLSETHLQCDSWNDTLKLDGFEFLGKNRSYSIKTLAI